MGSQNCLDFLNNYADLLSANTTISGNRPRPVLFSGENCTGTVWPATGGQPTDALVNAQEYSNPDNPTFGSMYIPGGWQVELKAPDGETGRFPVNTSDLPVLLSTVAGIPLKGSSGQGIENNIVAMTPFYPKNPDNTPYTDTEWKLAMCTNQISTVVGARHLTSWQQGSSECDAFMSGYCSEVANTGCAPGKNQPAPLPARLAPCVCLVEENCNREIFCEPGNTNPNCENEDTLQEFLPVTCFGKLCSEQGYRFARMINQRCTETLCQQIVRIVGQNIVVRGGSTIWCGNRTIPVPTTTVTPTVTNPPDSGDVVLPVYAWILIGIAIFLLFVTVPLAVVIYRRRKRKAMNTPLNVPAPTKPVSQAAPTTTITTNSGVPLYA